MKTLGVILACLSVLTAAAGDSQRCEWLRWEGMSAESVEACSTLETEEERAQYVVDAYARYNRLTQLVSFCNCMKGPRYRLVRFYGCRPSFDLIDLLYPMPSDVFRKLIRDAKGRITWSGCWEIAYWCVAHDRDGDGDIDLADFALFQRKAGAW